MRLGSLCLLPLVALAARSADAQWYRPVEVTVLSRYTGFDQALDARANTGLGARLNFAVGQDWRLEAEVSNTGARQFDPTYGRPAYVPFYLRATTQRRLGQRLSAVLGGGYVRNTYGSRNVDDAGVNLLAALQLDLTARVALRLDGVLDYMPSAWTEFVNGQKRNVNRGVQLGLAVPVPALRRAPMPLPRPPLMLETPRERPIDADPLAPEPEPTPRPLSPTGAGPEHASTGSPRVARAAVLDVEFPSGALLTPPARAALDDLAEALHERPALRIEIAGHADGVGPAAANLRLSRARAEAVRSYLAARGIDDNRMTVRALGGSRPLAAGEGSAAAARNRTVEIRPLGEPR